MATIVERHGGTVDVDSHEGAGTAITIRLPTAAPQHPSTNTDDRLLRV
ncbi:hypothetical protein [Krasilnikovia cinnamomea]